MASLEIRFVPDKQFRHPALRALIVSDRREVRRSMVEVLETLLIDTSICSSCSMAQKILRCEPHDVVVCDERLADGSYADLLHPEYWERRTPRLIVASQTGDWESYLEARQMGAFDVVSCSWHTNDLKLSLIRALRECDLETSPHTLLMAR